MINILYIAIVSLILNVNAQSSHNTLSCKKPEISWIQGEWHGTGFQSGLEESTSWTISLYADTRNQSYTIVYPSLNCSGELKLVTGDNNIALFKEVITKGLDVCMDGGKLIITKVDENHISYSYFFPENELVAFSTLVRKKIKE